jgi:TRAP-type C4-dicarboxylate transport system permease small subunit
MSASKARSMNLVGKLDTGLLKIEEFILTYGIIALAVLMISNVIARVIFQHSFTFTEEIAQSLVVLVTFLGLGYCTRKARHIRMTALFDIAPFWVRKTLIIFVSLVTGIVLLALAYWATQYTLKVYGNASVTPALRLPRYFIIIWVPIGLFMCSVEYFMAVFKNFKEREVYLSIEKTDEYEEEEITAYQRPGESSGEEPEKCEPSHL